MDGRKQKVLRAICELGRECQISFQHLDTDKSKAGLIVEIVKTVLWMTGKVGSDFAWRGSAHHIYVDTHWMTISSKEITLLLTTIANLGGIHEYKAKHHRFAEELYKQFRSAVREMDVEVSEVIKINCDNGTLVFGTDGVKLFPFAAKDHFFYKLNYGYVPDAIASEFQRVLDDALPRDAQMILQEYVASIFLPRFNHQKALLLYGRGGEGKSLIISILSAALGKENVVERSIESLCAEESRTVADLEGKLLNICYEMSSKFSISNFKRLVSKEPMTAKRLYMDPYTIYDYASLLFACNELPRNIEYTNAYFRRLIILPFLRSIPEEKQDRTLGDRIIANEISGVLNWIVEGVKRLMSQGRFSDCDIASQALANYKIDSDSVASFIDDNNYEKSTDNKDCISLQELFKEYMYYCSDSNCHACSLKTFSARLKNVGFEVIRKSLGMFVYAKKTTPGITEPVEISTSNKYEWTIDENNQ